MSSMAFYASIGEPFTEADMPPPPTHCNCGRRLVHRLHQDGFTPQGQPDIEPEWRCPATLGWWNRASLRFMTHDEYEPDRFIDPFWRLRTYR